jgi:hypothetical protein
VTTELVWSTAAAFAVEQKRKRPHAIAAPVMNGSEAFRRRSTAATLFDVLLTAESRGRDSVLQSSAM